MTDPITTREAGYDATRKPWLSTLLYVLSGLATGAAFGFWFMGTWTHGHDASTRLAASGFLCLLVAIVFLISGAATRAAGR